MHSDANRIALQTIDENKQAIIFLPSRASAEKHAEELSKKITNKKQTLKDAITQAGKQTKQCKRLANCAIKGIAFHHSGLTSKQKEIIEDEFREGTIKVICATPTLAAGLSLPVFRVIIGSLKRYSGNWGMDWIPVLEYLQMAGRAGRPEYEKFGEAIVIATSPGQHQEIIERYIQGKPESIYSKLAAEPVLRMYILSLIASGVIRDEPTMQNFFAQTFWAHQYGDLEQLYGIMHKTVELLRSWCFLEGQAMDFAPANQTTKSLRATPLGKRVAQLYLDPLTAQQIVTCLQQAHNPSPFALLHMIGATLEIRPHLRVKAKDREWIETTLFERQDTLLLAQPPVFSVDYQIYLDALKTALFLEDWSNEMTEDDLFTKYGIRPGEIRYKQEAADWLLRSCQDLATTTGKNELSTPLAELRLRIKHGVKSELLPLLRLTGIGKIRARKLFNNNLRTITDIKRVPLPTLTNILGQAIAHKVKIQVGEKIETQAGLNTFYQETNRYDG